MAAKVKASDSDHMIWVIRFNPHPGHIVATLRSWIKLFTMIISASLTSNKLQIDMGSSLRSTG